MPETHKRQSFAENVGIQVYELEGKNVKLQVNLVVRSCHYHDPYFGFRFLALVKAVVITSTTFPWKMGPWPEYIFVILGEELDRIDSILHIKSSRDPPGRSVRPKLPRLNALSL
jgi:hypothetical protein